MLASTLLLDTLLELIGVKAELGGVLSTPMRLVNVDRVDVAVVVAVDVSIMLLGTL